MHEIIHLQPCLVRLVDIAPRDMHLGAGGWRNDMRDVRFGVQKIYWMR